MTIAAYSLMYEKYFTMSYLIKYGYFNFKYASKKREEDYILSNIVYKEILYTSMIEQYYDEIKQSIKFNSKQETTPVELSIYKNEGERRTYKLPNFYSYICLCEHLCSKKNIYISILDLNQKSLSKNFYHSTFLQGKIRKDENRFGKKRIFKTDIQNFFPSIYTHSIPWALVGKSEAKRNKTKQNEYYNQLDSLIQKCQRGETHGIPTGSFASHLIAEIYLCKLDEKMEKYQYVRYVDDFEFPYNEESDKENFYKDLNKELNELNLKVKVEKNQIDLFPFQTNDNSSIFFDYFIIYGNALTERQSKYIHQFIDFSISREREGNKGSLKLLFKGLKSAIKAEQISKEGFTKTVLKRLFNLVLMTPHLTVYYLELIDELSDGIIQSRVKKSIIEAKVQIQDNLKSYIDLNYHQEIYSLLSILYYFKIDNICKKEHLLKIIEKMDDLSSVLAFELYIASESNIDEFIFEVVEKKLVNSLSWEEEYWLFKYHFFYRVNAEANSKLKVVHKDYLYDKYGAGVSKARFFNNKNIKKVVSPINLAYQQQNSNDDIAKFYQLLLKKKVTFLK
ncbi:RNA-directed DNA polymerase [Bacillus toyonensis]|uniref:RNA-directed DNA polymerase n=1 Tax=Bacillus toyonensis TaxID=155322 RepID=UPI000BF29B26|nr:RNA-directed DNA polymerase [Bacillus toyonensis]PGB61580.1 hypothetical protein COM00_15065 [Bacillus toyonensis]